MDFSSSHPKGTLAVLIIFLVVIALVWGGFYLILLGRG
ncbi:MAG: cytochrome c oxidase subunit 2A [Deltaproteobacteria bacterium]|nr:cytochrome c oxidase subunit 2A [Deltaproteobacteria bacterium]